MSSFPDVVSQLKRSAAKYREFPASEWKIAGREGAVCQLNRAGRFEGLVLEPAGELVLETEMTIPPEIEGVKVAGEPLEIQLNSLYPARLECEGAVLFEDDLAVPVAAGPALFRVVEAILEGGSVKLRHTVLLPANQISQWHFLSFTTPGLRAAAEAWDTLAAQLDLAFAFAGTESEKELCDRLAKEMTDALARKAGLNKLAELAVRYLDPVFGKRIRRFPVHLIGHCHIDLNWLWTWPDTAEVIRRDTRSVLDLMKEFPELTFSHSQAAIYDFLEREEPAMFGEVKARIAEGRWEVTAGTWVEQDHNIAGSESHARQLLHGVRYCEEKLGVVPTVYHAPDTFGHPGNLPQVAVSSGAKYYYHHRGVPAGDPPAYWWEGKDGTKLLALTTHGYNGQITAGSISGAVVRAVKNGHAAALLFHGIGDHGGGPSRQNLQALRRFQADPLLPHAFCSTLEAYGKAMEEQDLPVQRGESRTIFEGCYTTHGDAKWYNRRGENLLLSAESLTALAGVDARANLQGAWRKVLFNQFHDIAAGSAINEVYRDYATDFRDVENAARAVIEKAAAQLGGSLKDGEFSVVNPLPEARKDWVALTGADARLEAPGFVAEVSGFGSAIYPEIPEGAGGLRIAEGYGPFDNRLDNMLGDAAGEAPYYLVESKFFRIYLRRDCGVLVGFYDKRVGRELVGFGMRRQSDYLDTARPDLGLGVLQILHEIPHRMSSWQMHEVDGERSLITGAKSHIVEATGDRAVVRVVHQFGQSTITQTIAFYDDLPWVDYETEVDWQEPGDEKNGVANLKIAFCARLEECEAWQETAFGAERRPADGQEVPFLRWSGMGGAGYGIAVLNNGKYGGDTMGTRLRLSLVRSAYDPDAIADRGRHVIRYRFVPHVGGWREADVPAQAAAFNAPLIVSREGGEKDGGWTPRISTKSVRLSCFKHEEAGAGYLLRLHETGGGEGWAEIGNLPPGWKVFETDIVEKTKTPIEQHGSWQSGFRPWQIRTFIVEPQ